MRCPTGDSSQKRFMAYNAMGCIICKDEEDYNVIEVAMHDTRAQRRRMPHLNDLYRFSMAALGERVGPPQPACDDWQHWPLSSFTRPHCDCYGRLMRHLLPRLHMHA